MAVLSQLEPAGVFRFFEEICSIPHGSGNVERISDYLKKFAKDRGLFCIQDELKNIIIKKKGSAGYEDKEPVIIQGHMDMVAVKKPDSDIDMKKDGLRLAVDGDFLFAEGTSLGGDDGIAVAYALALLDDDFLEHPPLEVIITVDEETGMDGAIGIDLDCIKGRRMLNLDSEEEGIFLVSCAGGSKVSLGMDVCREEEETSACRYTILVDGLIGGHSGTEINKGRMNSNLLMARILDELKKLFGDLCLVTMEGGLADNAIPRRTEAVIELPSVEAVDLEKYFAVISKELHVELDSREPKMMLSLEKCLSKTNLSYEGCTPVHSEDFLPAVSEEETGRIIRYLLALPNGVIEMSADIPGLVETSLNVGIVRLDENGMETVISVRSNIESAKRMLIHRLEAVAALAGADISVNGDYPGWSYRKDSPLRDKMIQVYKGMYGVEPKVEALHAGLECGILASKLEGLDCVSFGPNIHDIHTTEERLEIGSTKRCWEYILELLKHL
ncbi:MAG: aminoacyl-histidine dipeptidase [Lachnospiraceae bacterium]|nr:aminoacyl-histidine dipeptidase [Lachnospiraceae bacterium]